jgi:hypothetical protein
LAFPYRLKKIGLGGFGLILVGVTLVNLADR